MIAACVCLHVEPDIASATAGAGGGGPPPGFAPFTSEAIQRGVSYNTLAYPQTAGIYGLPVAWSDLDGDGDPDLLAGGHPTGRLGVWENTRGVFVDRQPSSGLPDLPGISALSLADVDADGDVDLLCTMWGAPSRYFQQIQPFTFAEATEAIGLATDGPARCASWGDVNGDGWLDLFIARYAGGIAGTLAARSHLYLNQGGSLVEVGELLGVGSPAYSFLGSFVDLDRDTIGDFVLSNDRGFFPPHYQGNQAWRVSEAGLLDLSDGCGLGQPLYSMGMAPADFNRDGVMDLFVANINDEDQPLGPVNPLFIAQGPWQYTEECEAWGLLPGSNTVTAWSTLAADFDNDGWTDLAVNNQLHPNALYRNGGDSSFQNVTTEAWIGGPNKPSYSSAAADLDADGDIDVASLELATSLRLLVNHEGERRASVSLEIVGEWPNTKAIGALVDVDVGNATLLGQVMAGGHGYLGQNELPLHFGLGGSMTTETITVRWPWHGATRLLERLPAGRWRVYPPSRLGDVDGDFEVDGTDDAAIAACLASGQYGGCEMFDFNGDGSVDGTDVGPYDLRRALSPADFDRSGMVDAADLAIVLSNWGLPNPMVALGGSDSVGGAELGAVLADWDG